MILIFTKPIELINAADVADLIAKQWPEGYEVEFKKTLPHKSGGLDPWLKGKNEIGDFARDEILAEVIAFANAQGGTIVLGIDETDDKPPRAKLIDPLPRVGDLSVRLEDQARSCIDPPLPRLQIRPIETDGKGGGIIVLRTSSSRKAPHRLATTREAFVRRGSSTQRMNMREIQEMTINVARGDARIDASFVARRDAFVRWGKQRDFSAAFRVTAVPLELMPDPGQLFNRGDLFPHFREFAVKAGQFANRVVIPAMLNYERPILRGMSRYNEDARDEARLELYRSGLIDFWFRVNHVDDYPPPLRLYQGWLLAGLANVLLLLDHFRASIGAPDAEYGLEIEFRRFAAHDESPVYYQGFAAAYGEGSHEMRELPILLPRVPVRERGEFDRIVNDLDTDVFDALGIRRIEPVPVQIQWPTSA